MRDSLVLPAPLGALAGYRRFINYTLEPDQDRSGKTVKRPVDARSGYYCNPTDTAHQYDYATATASGRPVGFVLDEADGFWFLDIDDCLQPGGNWSTLAQELCARFPGAAVEVSQSGRGLHLIGRGACPPHSCKNIPLGLELYTHQRFVALTGTHAAGDAGSDHSAALAALVPQYFPPNPHGEIAGWSDVPCDGWGGPTDDEELIRAAMASGRKSAAAAFGGDAVLFADLWNADVDKLGRKWPSSTGQGYDGSQADAALASHLAFWTGKDHARIERLMRRSGLARAKWDDRPGWLETTILRAASVVGRVAEGRPAQAPPGHVVTSGPVRAIQLREGDREFLSAADQLSFFAGCVYVVDQHKVWTPATGDLLDKPRFDVVYAGHAFPLDNRNEKVSDSPFDALTKSRIFEAPRADRLCFRPEYGPGELIPDDGRLLLNTYFPIATRRVAGDLSPFTNHLEKLLRNPRDRQIIVAFMASMVRNPGRKFQWCPVIIGPEGNGKSLLNRLMQFCIGARYTHLVNPEAMAKTGNQFNAWIEQKLYVGIEEIYVGEHRRDFLESFKTTVTDDRLAVEGKGDSQGVGDNRANLLLFSNHRAAVPVTVDSRRYCVLITDHECADDIERDGMGGDYFPKLYDWFYGRGEWAEHGPFYGAAVVNEWLHTVPIAAELDPAGMCVRAPAGSRLNEAIQASLGRAEQEILEAVEEGRPGFAGGWISSLMVDRLLDHMRTNVPRTKRRAMLKSLGYDYHPALTDGRVNSVLQPDGGKPRLYIKAGHLAASLADVQAIERAYVRAQETATQPGVAARFGS